MRNESTHLRPFLRMLERGKTKDLPGGALRNGLAVEVGSSDPYCVSFQDFL